MFTPGLVYSEFATLSKLLIVSYITSRRSIKSYLLVICASISRFRIYSDALATAVNRLWMLLGIPNYCTSYGIPNSTTGYREQAVLGAGLTDEI